jgi:hypothetical protein
MSKKDMNKAAVRKMTRDARQRRYGLTRFQQRQGGYGNLIVQVVIAIVAAVISYATQPKPVKPKPASLEDFDLPTPDEGTPQRVLFGERRCQQWMLTYWGNLRADAIKTKSGK